nr:hypothetical protein [uncultured Methanoregula sp.]
MKIFEQTLVENPPSRSPIRRGIQNNRVHKWLTFRNRTLIEISQADFEFNFSTTPCFKNFNRDQDRDQKIDLDRSHLDFHFSIKP